MPRRTAAIARAGRQTLGPWAFGLRPLSEPQHRFIACEHQFALFLGGWGAGKTQVGLLWALLEALRPEHRGRGRTRGAPIAVFAPTYRQSKLVHEERLLAMCAAFADEAGWPILRHYAKAEMTFHLRGGSRIMLLSYDRSRERLLSMEFGGALIDELDMVDRPDEAWSVITSRVRIPTARCRVRVTTTPNGWRGASRIFLEAEERAQKHPDPRERFEARTHYRLVRAPSWSNPYLPREKIRAWRHQFSVVDWRQYVCAEVLRPADAVFPEFSARRHVLPFGAPEGEWSVAVDWGYTAPHVLFGTRARVGGVERLVIYGEWYEDDVAPERVVAAVEAEAMRRRCDPVLIAADPAGKRENRMLRARFPRARWWVRKGKQQEVWAGIQRVRAWLDPADGSPPKLIIAERLALDRGRGIVRSLEQLPRRRVDGVPQDAIKPGTPWEHATDALRYLVLAHEREASGAVYNF